MTRTCAISSAASISKSRPGSVFTDSTGMPSAATSDSAIAPSMRSVMLLSRSRNMGGSSLQGPQVARQQLDLAGSEPANVLLLHSREQLGGGELLRAAGADGFEAGEGRLVL